MMNLETPTRGEQRGSSLIETLVALSILATALLFIFGALSSFSLINSRNQTRTHAAVAARTLLEELRFEDPATLPDTGSQTSTANIGQYQFTIVTQFCVNSSYCDDHTRHVVVRVQEDGQQVFETETVITQLR